MQNILIFLLYSRAFKVSCSAELSTKKFYNLGPWSYEAEFKPLSDRFSERETDGEREREREREREGGGLKGMVKHDRTGRGNSNNHIPCILVQQNFARHYPMFLDLPNVDNFTASWMLPTNPPETIQGHLEVNHPLAHTTWNEMTSLKFFV